MHLSPARWTTALAAAALIALPGAAFAQANPPQNPPSQPTTQTQPPAQPPAQPQPQAQPQAQSAAPGGQIDANAAKQHLTEARDALSQMASMPAAAKLQGDARSKVSDLISNFNALITTQSDWRSEYAKVNDSLTALIGPDTDQSQSQSGAAGTAASVGTTGTGTTGSTGTTGTAATATEANASGVQLDPSIRGKLVEFRTHLKEFEKAAGGAAEPSPSAAAAPASAPATAGSSSSEAGSMPPAAATASTSSPANPAIAVSGAAGTSGREQTKPEPTGTTGTTPAAAASGSADQNVSAAAQSELAAIDAILANSKTGALTKTQTAELRRHVEALRSLLNQK